MILEWHLLFKNIIRICKKMVEFCGKPSKLLTKSCLFISCIFCSSEKKLIYQLYQKKYRIGQKKHIQILIYNFLWTIGLYCAESCTLNIHSIWNLFLNFVRDYFSKQLNMEFYRRFVIFTLCKIDVKITKISFFCCFHCDF